MHEWFAHPNEHSTFSPSGELGLSFACTMCGNCCTGPEGYVLVADAEIRALAARFSLPEADFRARYTHMTSAGLSLTERLTDHGNDCVFLDREKFPGKAVCGVYEDRPAQCRTWPFWKSNLTTRDAWAKSKRRCPGMNATGPGANHYTVQQIRILRDRVDI
jgi:uncharacterized protein